MSSGRVGKGPTKDMRESAEGCGVECHWVGEEREKREDEVEGKHPLLNVIQRKDSM